MAGFCEVTFMSACMAVFYMYMVGTDVLSHVEKVSRAVVNVDECDMMKTNILRTCPSWNMCEMQLKTMRCRSNPVRARLSTEMFHPYIARLMFEGKTEFFGVFGKSDDIALISFTHSVFNDEGGAIDFIKLVGGISDSDDAELIALKMPLRSRELVGSPFCKYYQANISRITVPEKYELWKTDITDRVCLDGHSSENF